MPGAGPLMRADFRRLYADRLAYIDELIGPEDWPEVDQHWEELFNIKSSSRMREEVMEYAGMGAFASMGENDPVTYDQMVQGPYKTFNHVLYGLGFQVGYLAGKHDIDGIIGRNAPELGRSMRMSIQTLGFDILNGAFATHSTADGKYICADDHTFIRGGSSWDNKATATLGHSALETGLITFDNQKDLMGNPMPMQAATLWIPPALRPMAHELLQSKMRHDTTTHAESFVYNSLTVKSSPFITTSTYWFILAPTKTLKTRWYWNVRPETSHGFDFDKGAAKTKTLFAASYGCIDARGIYGSTGGA